MQAVARLAEPPHAASPTDWQAALALLDDALDLDPAARAGWLAELGAGHAHLTPLLARLLAAHTAPENDEFMRVPAHFLVQNEPVAGALAAGDLVGPYRLLRELGQGGMATVWLAERADGLLARHVALKLPHLSWGGAAFTDRMARERSILASLTHPNIARLYDAGIAADGRPFLALQHIVGTPIDAYAREQQLGLRARIGLVVQVARAVAHAHACLVVHRDLKPSNILVDAKGHVQLLDFGIAKLVDLPFDAGEGPQPTQSFARALTPDYASPEQIRGDAIHTASDIFSLGVVAFELLADARPYRLPAVASAVALAAAMASTPVLRASSATTDPARRAALHGDLDAILAKALAKASSERYLTADAFADDLERHLAGQPVRARAPSFVYVAGRWLRRHTTEAAIAAAVVVAGLGGAYAQVLVLLALAGGKNQKF